MNTYILLTGIMFMVLTYMWSSQGSLNVCVKAFLTCMTIWSGYLLFGPSNLIMHLEKF